MAISDYILSQLRARQTLAEQEYNRKQLALQQEQARIQREQQRQKQLLEGIGAVGDIAIKGIGMGAGMLEQQAAKEAAGRLAEAQARAELAGAEEITPEEMEVQEQLPQTLEGIEPEGVMPTAGVEEKLAGLKPSPLEPEPLQPRPMGPEADRAKEVEKIKSEQEQRTAAREAIQGLGLLGVEDLTAPEEPPEETMEFTLEDVYGPAKPAIEEKVAEEPVMEALPEGDFEPGMEEIEPLKEDKVEQAIEKAEKMSGIRIRKFVKSPNELAQQIVDEVYAKKPQGNPLLQFFSGDPAKMEREKLIAKATVAKQIKETRKALLEEDYNRFMKERGMDLKQKQLEIAEIAKNAALVRANRSEIRLKTNRPSADRKVLFGYKQAQDQLGRTVKYAKKLLDNGEGFPIGKVRAAIQAYINENAGVEGSISTGIGAGAGIPVGGLNVNINQARTKQIDSDLLNDAFKALDKTNLSTNQRQFLQNLNIAIQNIGKSMEGGKLTDKDLLFYLDNLISSDDPQSALISINDLMERNFDEFNALRENLAGSYELSALAGFEPIEPTLFTQEEIESAFEAGIGPAAAAMGQRAQIGMGAPQTQLSAGVSQALNKILEALRTEKDPGRQQRLIQQARQLMGQQGDLGAGFPGE
jgi:hypothetical protein